MHSICCLNPFYIFAFERLSKFQGSIANNYFIYRWQYTLTSTSIKGNMTHTEIFYHGSCHLFNKFSLTFLGSGEGKSKFGHGIYITSNYKTAALYASKAANANGKKCCYVYTVAVPALTENNHIFSCKSVNADIVTRVEKATGRKILEEANNAGKLFRNYLGNLLTGQSGIVKKNDEQS